MRIGIKGFNNTNLRLFVDYEYVGRIDLDHDRVYLHYRTQYTDKELVDAINEYYMDKDHDWSEDLYTDFIVEHEEEEHDRL